MAALETDVTPRPLLTVRVAVATSDQVAPCGATLDSCILSTPCENRTHSPPALYDNSRLSTLLTSFQEVQCHSADRRRFSARANLEARSDSWRTRGTRPETG